jgi:hypothetical protein
MHWSEYDSSSIGTRNGIRAAAAGLAIAITMLGGFLLTSGGSPSVQEVGTAYVTSSLICYAMYAFCAWTSTAESHNIWSEILLRPGQLLARMILGVALLPGLLLVAAFKMLWWIFCILVGLIYSATREYRSETLAAFLVWMRLDWHDAPFGNIKEAYNLFEYWAQKRDDPRTRAQKLKERHEQRITEIVADLSDLERERNAHKEVERQDALQTELLTIVSPN